MSESGKAGLGTEGKAGLGTEDRDEGGPSPRRRSAVALLRRLFCSTEGFWDMRRVSLAAGMLISVC